MGPPTVTIDEWDKLSRDLRPAIPSGINGSRPLSLSGPSGWRNQDVSTLEIPPRPKNHHRRSIEQFDRDESLSSLGSHEYDEDSKQRQHQLTPGSAHSGSSWNPSPQDLSDDDISTCTKNDRGYTAAERKFAKTLSRGEPTTIELLSGIGAQSNSGFSLSSQIRLALQPYGGSNEPGNKKWLPFDKLYELTNESVVYQELLRVLEDKFPLVKLGTYTQQICGSMMYKDDRSNTLTTSSRQIFAILTLMNQVSSVPEFVDAGLSDKHLPLDPRPDTTNRKYNLCSISSGKVWPVANDWLDHNFDNFMMYQAYMLSPFFELKSRELPFHDLHLAAVLPFIEEHQNDRPRKGHHGSVWRVKIHHAHHDFIEDDKCENPYFAVKKLESSGNNIVNRGDFKNEVNAWAKSVGVKGHPHLIRLLATWCQDRCWHLLFPWAKCNLRDFWIRHDRPKSDPSLIQWIAKQCLGIAQGLRKIHRSGSGDPQDAWGIHGDIKPDNILLFDDPDDEHGILVICDFGFTRFHGKDTISDAPPAGYTATYRAPEYDMRFRISRAYDMWTLGCLYLEFITWYLTGYGNGAEVFCTNRTKEDRGEYFATDKFFVCVSIDEIDMRGAIVKPCVLNWIRHLRSQENCSRFFHDFLDMIERDLLLIEPQQRKKCDWTVRKLHGLNKKCIEEGDSYIFTGSPRPMNETLNSVQNDPVAFSYPATERERMIESEFPLQAVLTGGHYVYASNTWQVDSGSSSRCQETQPPLHANIDHVLVNNLSKQVTAKEYQLEMNDEDAGEETPLLHRPRASREIRRQIQESHSLTRSPESLERKDFKPPSLPTPDTSTTQTVSQRIEALVNEDDDGDETWSTESSHNQGREDSPLIQSTIDGSHDSTRGSLSSWHETKESLRRFGGWLGHWFGCGNTRTEL